MVAAAESVGGQQLCWVLHPSLQRMAGSISMTVFGRAFAKKT
jgi:hypothetical protein